MPDAENRHKMIALILAARDQDEQAVNHLENALRKWNVEIIGNKIAK
jgi:hypothetical protein